MSPRLATVAPFWLGYSRQVAVLPDERFHLPLRTGALGSGSRALLHRDGKFVFPCFRLRPVCRACHRVLLASMCPPPPPPSPAVTDGALIFDGNGHAWINSQSGNVTFVNLVLADLSAFDLAGAAVYVTGLTITCANTASALVISNGALHLFGEAIVDCDLTVSAALTLEDGLTSDVYAGRLLTLMSGVPRPQALRFKGLSSPPQGGSYINFPDLWMIPHPPPPHFPPCSPIFPIFPSRPPVRARLRLLAEFH